MGKTIFFFHEYGSSPEYGTGGRNFYIAERLVEQVYKVKFLWVRHLTF